MNTIDVSIKPWYREPWPWLLMAGPAAVIVAGAVTIWMAVASSDGLVAEDYYKRGLAINQTLQREAFAAQLGLRAEVRFSGDGRQVELMLQAREDAVLPEALQLRVVHPTRDGRDARVLLRRAAAGSYQGTGPARTAGRWLLVLEDQQAVWRLDGAVVLPDQDKATLAPAGSR